MSDEASRHLRVFTRAITTAGLDYELLDGPEYASPFGVGLVVNWGDGDFTVASVPEEGTIVYLTNGILWDVQQNDKLTLLEACNDINADHVTPTCYLHDGEDVAWSILRQVKMPIKLALEAPEYFKFGVLQPLASAFMESRDLLDERGIVGQTWKYSPWAVATLFRNSMF